MIAHFWVYRSFFRQDDELYTYQIGMNELKNSCEKMG